MESSRDYYGYDEDIFVSEVPDYFHCMVCSLVLRNPVQILCCGHKMCSACFERIRTLSITADSELRCPIDRNLLDLTDVHEDIYLKRLVGNLVVRCHDHARGCKWTGDLRELDTHTDQCPLQLQKQEARMIKELAERLEQCESSLGDKDNEIAFLRQQVQDQQQLKEEVWSLKQQQEQHLGMQQQQQEKITELAIKIAQLEGSEAPGQNFAMTPKISSDLTSAPVAEEQPDTFRESRTVVEHLSGDIALVNINNDYHRVKFFGKHSVTVSARNAIVPPYSKVWYEVEYIRVRCCSAWNMVGWVTPDFPCYCRISGEVIHGTECYWFDPFFGEKRHNGHAEWGKKVGDQSSKFGVDLNLAYGSVIGVALDLVNGVGLFSVEGQWTMPMGVAFTEIPCGKKLFPAFTGIGSTLDFNFGDRPFTYSPPDSTYTALIDVV